MENAGRTVGSVIEHVFTHDNPTTGSRAPAHMAWVIFAQGTVFFTAPTEDLRLSASLDELEGAAKRALTELGPVVPGTPAADFNPTLLESWFPGERVYFVGYDHPDIATIVLGHAQDDLAAGLRGRACRDADLAALEVVEVRGFTGEVRRGRGASGGERG